MTHRTPQRKTVFLLALCALVSGGCPPRREPVLTGDQINNRARPATVIVAAKFEVSIQVPELVADYARLRSDFNAAVSGDMTDEERLKLFFNLFLGKSGRYLRAGSDRQQLPPAQLYSLGTGFIITPDGYLLTNAHVVKPNDSALALKSVLAISDQIDKQVDALNEVVRTLLPGHEMTKQARETVIRTFVKEYLDHGAFEARPAEAIALMGYDDGPGNTEPNYRSCEILKVGNPGSGSDVAVLKIQGEGDLPTVPLATGTVDSLRTGVDLFVVGYPGALAFAPSFTPSSGLDSSLSQGRVNGFKEMTDGTKVIQMDAVIHPGNSGSPVFDANGRALGLATFIVDDEDGAGTRNLSFVVSIDAARPFLKELRITPRQSAFTATYLEALRQYEDHHNTKALALFRRLNEQRPDVVAIHEFMKRLEKGGEPGPTGPVVPPLPPPETGWREGPNGVSLPLVIFGALGLLIVVAIALVIAGANRK